MNATVERVGKALGFLAILFCLIAVAVATAGAQQNEPVKLTIKNESSDRVAIYVTGESVSRHRIATVDVGQTTTVKLSDSDVRDGNLQVTVQPMSRDAVEVEPMNISGVNNVRLTVQTFSSRLTPNWGR